MSNFFVGKIINSIKIASDKEALLFICEDGEYTVMCDADCCSHTWIEHMELPALGFPAKVMSQEDLEMSEGVDHPEYDYLQFYGHKMTTDRGEIVIDYRNSSNGYYGGNLTWPDSRYHYGGVYNQSVSNNDWVDIVE